MNETDKFIADFKRWNAENDARVEADVAEQIRERRREDLLLLVLHLIVPFCIAMVVGVLIYLMPEGV